ncbi:MAG: hypothetical protein ACRCXM_12245, partial [Beijerinckiaceae bacterium]
ESAMTMHRRECKAMSGPNAPKRSQALQAPRADAAIRNFFVAVGNLGAASQGKRAGGKTAAAQPVRPGAGKTGRG